MVSFLNIRYWWYPQSQNTNMPRTDDTDSNTTDTIWFLEYTTLATSDRSDVSKSYSYWRWMEQNIMTIMSIRAVHQMKMIKYL